MSHAWLAVAAAALVLALSARRGECTAAHRALRRRTPRAITPLVAAEPAAAPPPPVGQLPTPPPLTVRDALPSEVDAVAELLSTAFYPERRAAWPSAVSVVGLADTPFDPRGVPRSARWRLPSPLAARLGRAAAEVGKFWLKASIAQRLSAEAFAQGFENRPPAGSLTALDSERAPEPAIARGRHAGAAAREAGKGRTAGACTSAYALLVVEVELPDPSGSGAVRRELAAAVEVGIELVTPLPPLAAPLQSPPPGRPSDGGDGDGGDASGAGAMHGASSEAERLRPAPALPSSPPHRTARAAARRHSVPYVTSLAVAPEHRRRGAARQLLARAEALALAWGYDEIVLDARAQNTPAVELYASAGYVLEGRTPVLDLPVAMLLRGDRASGRWRKQLRANGDGEAEAEARARRAVVALSLIHI